MPPKALILGFDTSAAHCAAALLCGDTCLISKHEDMRKGQAERLMPMLEEVLKEADKSWSDLTAIGVGIGPGNFTGTRIAVSAARGLAMSLACPAIGVSALEAQAFGSKGRVLSLIDARQNRAYAQEFHDGEPAGAPFLDMLEALPSLPRIGMGHDRPILPMAHAIAHIAATRKSDDVAPPAPLYLRDADAALPSEPPPRILT